MYTIKLFQVSHKYCFVHVNAHVRRLFSPECAAAELSPAAARDTTHVAVGVATTPSTTAAAVGQSSAAILTATRRRQGYDSCCGGRGYNTVYYSCCRGTVVSRNTNCY